MNAHQYCIDLVKKQENLQAFGVNIVDEIGLKPLPSVSVKKRTIRFPRLLEGFVILDEIEAYDQFITMYLAWCMLQNFEFEKCNAMLTKLEKIKPSNNNKPSNLFNTVVTKLLFMLLHEYGHYGINTNSELYKLLMDGAQDALSTYKDGERNDEKIANEVKSDFDSLINTNPEISLIFDNDIWKNYANSSFYSKAGGTVDNKKKQEEIGADFFAVSSLLFDTFFSFPLTYQYKSDLTDAVLFLTRMGVLDQVFYKENTIDSALNSNTNAFDSIRNWASISFIHSVEDGDAFSSKDSETVYSRHISKCAKYIRILLDNGDELDTISEISHNGSLTLNNESKYNHCYWGIISYVDDLTQLYN